MTIEKDTDLPGASAGTLIQGVLFKTHDAWLPEAVDTNGGPFNSGGLFQDP